METDQNLRQRKRNQKIEAAKELTETDISKPKPKPKPNPTSEQLGSTFWLTRIVFLRCLSIIYFVAFLISYNQVPV
jgi:hypothetical protein